MTRITIGGMALVIAGCLGAVRAADVAALWGCTGPGPAGGGCGPACTATWHEEKTTKPAYSMKCEYACARARDSWHAPPPECRCCPPAGAAYVKKRLYKSEGKTRVERVPKYESTTAGAGDGCVCTGCTGDGPAVVVPPFPVAEALP